MAQAVGLIDPHSVNHLSPILGNHMEQVIDHAGVRAMLAHFQIKGGVHVHGYCAAKNGQVSN